MTATEVGARRALARRAATEAHGVPVQARVSKENSENTGPQDPLRGSLFQSLPKTTMTRSAAVRSFTGPRKHRKPRKPLPPC